MDMHLLESLFGNKSSFLLFIKSLHVKLYTKVTASGNFRVSSFVAWIVTSCNPKLAKLWMASTSEEGG